MVYNSKRQTAPPSSIALITTYERALLSRDRCCNDLCPLGFLQFLGEVVEDYENISFRSALGQTSFERLLLNRSGLIL